MFRANSDRERRERDHPLERSMRIEEIGRHTTIIPKDAAPCHPE
jgi:hypothetical protein